MFPFVPWNALNDIKKSKVKVYFGSTRPSPSFRDCNRPMHYAKYSIWHYNTCIKSITLHYYVITLVTFQCNKQLVRSHQNVLSLTYNNVKILNVREAQIGPRKRIGVKPIFKGRLQIYSVDEIYFMFANAKHIYMFVLISTWAYWYVIKAT